MTRVLVSISVLAVVALAAPAALQAQISVEKQDQLVQKAEAQMLAGNYAGALPLYVELFGQTRRPVYLRNAGRCHQFLKHPNEAILDFRQYLQVANDLTDSERREVEGFIAEMEALRHQGNARDRTPEQPPATAAAPALGPPGSSIGAPPDASAQPALAGGETSGAAGADRNRTLRVAGIATGAVGIAAVAVGVAFSLRTRSLEDKVQSAPKFNADDASAGNSAQAWQWPMYAVGVAALATGAVLYVLGSRQPHEGVVVLPQVIPQINGGGVAGVQVATSF